MPTISANEEPSTAESIREWDFCDQCIFFRTCFRPERKQGDGCFEAFYPYPYSAFTDEQIAMKSRMLLGILGVSG